MAAAPAVQPSPRPRFAALRHDLDLPADRLGELLDLTQQVKLSRPRFASALKGRYLTLLFEKPSLRTRLTFELAIKQLGADCVTQTGPIDNREPVQDVARNLARWCDAIIARTFTQDTIDQLSHWSGLPVINALSDLYHPCQALADMFTLKEHFGRVRGLKLAFVGDGNNVAHSLLLSCARLGIHCSIATPAGYEPQAAIVQRASEFARDSGSLLEITDDPAGAVRSADAVYTDVWASMGQESEAATRNAIFAPYQLNDSLLEHARPDTLVMHCMPAKRGLEITESLFESPRGIAFDQAENRLHVQKALLLMLLA